MITIDGTQWSIPCKISRVSEMRASEISGMLLNKQYFADVLGTFLQYNLDLYVPFGKEEEYADLYEKLTEPVGSHTFTVPYNQGEREITGRIENVNDTLIERTSGHYWMDISFNVISNNPSKTMDLETVINTGIPPLPDESDAEIDDAYIFTASGWQTATAADELYY